METLKNGVYLMTREEIIKDQKNWSNSDISKHRDFSNSAFWVITNNGIVEGYDSRDEIIKVVVVG